jgi:protein AFG1
MSSTLTIQLISPTASYSDPQGLSDQIISGSAMFTGEEEVFAFARACSRLVQMGSREWAESAGQV